MSHNSFRICDSKVLHTLYQDCVQFKEIIEQTVQAGTGPESLPDSQIPTGTLYDLAACYLAMYDMLLAKDMLEFNTAKLLKTAKIH